ncbi:MAG: nucleotidyltransferase family protein, partial [Caldilinea sp.]|nr:nucleotidyltransferase family protein [Caldilinea sp.]
AAGIETMVLKGGYLAFQVYPDPALRGMSDLDLLFQPAALSAAEAVLQSLGYEGKHKSADEGPGIVKHTSTYKRAGPDAAISTPNPYLSTAGDRHVDPHGSLEESWFGLRVDVTPGIWQRSRSVTLVDQPVRAMADEDLLLHLSVHLVYHLLMSKPSLVQLYDIALVSQTLPLNWEMLAARARDRQAIPFLYAALHLASNIYGAPIPARTLAGLHDACSSRQAQRIERMGLADVVQQTQRPPLVTIRQRLARGISDRRETAQWAPTVAGKWAVWRTAVDIGKTDTGKLLGEKISSAQLFSRRRTGSV